jgi:type II secretory pathway pseudopilin PulG
MEECRSVTVSSASSCLKPVTDQRSAFSVIEIVVVVGLMSFIILGLMQMFNQTQRAFKLGTTQVDVLEGGRALMDMMQRELSQMKPANASNTVNFYSHIAFAGGYKPLLQELPGIPAPPGNKLPSRTNILQEIFFLTEENRTWKGTGYFVSSPAEGVGTLYRCDYKLNFGDDPRFLFVRFDNDLSGFYGAGLVKTNMTRLLDGVVHMRVRAYNTNGLWITNSAPFKIPFNVFVQQPYTTAYPQPVPAVHEVEIFRCYSNVVPASVDLELGILEDSAIAKIKAIYNPGNLTAQATSRRNYLTNQASRTHLFRARVPIRNVDPTAYQ